MGSTALQHRVATGLFYLAQASSPCKRRKRRSCRASTRTTTWGSTTPPPGVSVVRLAVLCLVLGYCCWSLTTETIVQGEERTVTSSTATATASTVVNTENVYDFAGLLLLLAGDVELNPGPVTALVMTDGLTKLVIDAPDGPVKDILLTWSPDKDVKADMNKKFKVPELRQTLAWLKNCAVESSQVKSLNRKADILDAILVALERLLPDQCGVCSNVYTVERESSPAVQCSGCQQGFHQECLETVLGNSTMPVFPGSLYWLCEPCSPNYSLMTAMGSDGKTQKPRSKRVVTESAPSNPATDGETTGPETSEPPRQSADLNSENSETPAPPNAAPHVDCPLLVRGDCPYGRSGKKDGVCQYLHRNRCSTYMNWGDRAEKGCKKVPCDKLHPLVCPRSLDLLCLEKVCDVRLHTKKCKRGNRPPSANDARGNARPTGSSATRNQPKASEPRQVKVKPPVAGQPDTVVGAQAMPSQGWAHHHPGVVWPGAHAGPWAQPHSMGTAHPGSYAGQPYPAGGLPGVGGLPGPVGGYPAVWPSGHAYGAGAGGQLGWPGPYVQPTPSGFSGPVWPGGHTQTPGNFNFPNNLNLQASAVPGQQQSSFPSYGSSFQTRCTTPDPAVHQMLEVWAGNIQRELVKQTETILSNKMKDMITQLGGQSGPRHFC